MRTHPVSHCLSFFLRRHCTGLGQRSWPISLPLRLSQLFGKPPISSGHQCTEGPNNLLYGSAASVNLWGGVEEEERSIIIFPLAVMKRVKKGQLKTPPTSSEDPA